MLFGVGSAVCLAFYGAFGGAVAGNIASCGFAGTYFPLIAAHSAFELTGVVLCGAAGLKVGHAVLAAGPHAPRGGAWSAPRARPA